MDGLGLITKAIEDVVERPVGFFFLEKMKILEILDMFF